MRNKQILCVTGIMLSIVQNVCSQKDTSNQVTIRKNEIGLDIGNILLFTLGSSEFTQPIGISYKRVVNNWAFRTSISTRTTYYVDPGFNHDYTFYNDQVFYKDSVYYVRSGKEKTKYYIARIGAEYRHKFKRNFMFVAGCDFQVQLLKGAMVWTEYAYSIDSVSNAGTGQEFNYTTFLGAQNIMEQENRGYQFGLGLSAGFLFPMGKRWSLLTQARLSGLMGTFKRTFTDNVTNTTTSNKSVFFDFETGPALAELSLFYRF